MWILCSPCTSLSTCSEKGAFRLGPGLEGTWERSEGRWRVRSYVTWCAPAWAPRSAYDPCRRGSSRLGPLCAAVLSERQGSLLPLPFRSRGGRTPLSCIPHCGTELILCWFTQLSPHLINRLLLKSLSSGVQGAGLSGLKTPMPDSRRVSAR